MAAETEVAPVVVVVVDDDEPIDVPVTTTTTTTTTSEERPVEQERSASAQETAEVVAPDDDKHRFMTSVREKDATSDYHPTHRPHAVAELPEWIETGDASADADADTPAILPPERDVTDDEIARLKQETIQLPIDVVLEMLSSNDYDIQATIDMSKQFVVPQLVPQYVKEMFVANIAMERSAHPTRSKIFKEFYFTKTTTSQSTSNSSCLQLGRVCSTKALVEFYYSEKNKIGSNWRLEHTDFSPPDDEQEELDETLARNDITIVTRDPSLSSKMTRGQKAAMTRRANQLRKENGGLGGVEGSVDRESSVVSTVSAVDFRQQQRDGDDHFGGVVAPEDVPSTSSCSSSSSSSMSMSAYINGNGAEAAGTSSSGRKRRKRTAEERLNGNSRRSYPERDRRPPSYLEN